MSDWARKLDVLIRADLGRDVHAQAGNTRARRRRAGAQRTALPAGSVIEKRASYGERVAGPGAWRGISTRDIEDYLREQGPEFWIQALSEPDSSSGRVMHRRRQRRAATEAGGLCQQAEDQLERMRDTHRQLLLRLASRLS